MAPGLRLCLVASVHHVPPLPSGAEPEGVKAMEKRVPAVGPGRQASRGSPALNLVTFLPCDLRKMT